MIVSFSEALTYLKLESDDLTKAESGEITGLIKAAEVCLYNATGVTYTSRNALAKLFCRMLICDWYDGRGTAGEIGNNARGILTQLKYCKPGV